MEVSCSNAFIYLLPSLLYFHFKINMVIAKVKEKELVIIIGGAFNIKPYHTQAPFPVAHTKNIKGEISSTFFVFITFTICGMEEIEVSIPAIIPIVSLLSICC